MNKLKLIIPVFATLVAVFLFTSCGSESTSIKTVSKVEESYDVNGVKLSMVEIPAVTYGMGTRPDGRLVIGSPNIHQVILDGYGISKYPVTQELWKAVMGSNPSSVEGDNYPVDRVTIKDCQKFIKKLSKITGVPFYLPTEAQWEYAVNNGQATYIKNTKEWCRDNFSDEAISELEINPVHIAKVDKQVVRTDSERDALANYAKSGNVTFRVAVYTDKTYGDDIKEAIIDQKPSREQTCKNETIEVNGVKFDMIAVKGGKFTMGATPDQGRYAEDDEKPAHEVTVEDFEIGKYEVTVALYKAVMGKLPYGNDEKDANKPVVNMSWYRAQEFIIKLNQLTGRKFRLPTEAEWEYAARGGQYSRNTLYSGGSLLGLVGAYAKNTESTLQEVGKFQKNELGIYDMSGNAWEWCQDKFAMYGQEPAADAMYIMRGGSASSPGEACRVANRSKLPASNVKSTFGLRLAL